jgi:hypothetical protein
MNKVRRVPLSRPARRLFPLAPASFTIYGSKRDQYILWGTLRKRGVRK